MTNQDFIDVTQLEKELRELWEQMSSAKKEGQQEAVTRACVHNLIVYAPGERSDAEVNSIVGEVTIQNPGRVFILLPDPGSAESQKSAWVSAQCYKAGGKREQICCEQIMLRAKGKAVKDIPMILSPLVLPDLPVFLWWRSEMEQTDVFTELVEFADRIIFDSALSSGHEIRSSIEIFKSAGAISAYSDLDWSRLTFWRDLIARLFDSVEARQQFAEINRLEIQTTNLGSLQPLYLASWIASSLDWNSATRISSTQDKIEFGCTNGNQKVQIVITVSKPKVSGSILQSVELQSKSAKFSVVASEDSDHVEFLVYCQGRPGVKQLRKFVVPNEANLIRQELQILGRDRTFEKVVNFLSQIL